MYDGKNSGSHSAHRGEIQLPPDLTVAKAAYQVVID
jgi:hypothetical protein